MAGTPIKEYVIKIRADVDEAQKQLSELSKSLSKADPKQGINIDLSKQTSQITGAIGKITQKIGELQQSFDKINTDKLSTEIKSLSEELTKSINEMKQSFEGFKSIFSTFNESGTDEFSKSVNNFTKQIQTMMDSYKSAMESIDDIGTDTTGISTIGTVISSDADKLKEATNLLKQAGKQFKDARTDIDTLLSKEGKKNNDPTSILGLQSVVTNLQNHIKTVMDLGGDYKKALKNIVDTSPEALGVLNDSLNKEYKYAIKNSPASSAEFRRRRNAALKGNEEKSSSKQEEIIKKVYRVKVNLDVETVDDQKIDELVNKIQESVQAKLQKRLAENPVKIPLAFAPAVETKDLATKSEAEIAKQFKGSKAKATDGIIQAVQVQVNADAQNLVKQINDSIDSINKSNSLKKIEVDVVPRDITGNTKKINEIAQMIEDKIIERYSKDGGLGLTVDGSQNESINNIFNFNTSGLSTENTSQAILAAIQGLNRGFGGGFPNGFGGSGSGNIPPVPPTAPVQQQSKPQVEKKTEPSQVEQSIASQVSDINKSLQKPIETKVVDQGKPLETKSETKPQPQKIEEAQKVTQQAKQVATQVADEVTKRQNRYTRGYRGISTAGMMTTSNYNSMLPARMNAIYRYNNSLNEQFGLNTLNSLIYRDKTTIQDLYDSDVWNGVYSHDGKDYALYGSEGELLSDFRKRIGDLFNEGKRRIAEKMVEYTNKYAEQSLNELVPFGAPTEPEIVKEKDEETGKMREVERTFSERLEYYKNEYARENKKLQDLNKEHDRIVSELNELEQQKGKTVSTLTPGGLRKNKIVNGFRVSESAPIPNPVYEELSSKINTRTNSIELLNKRIERQTDIVNGVKQALDNFGSAYPSDKSWKNIIQKDRQKRQQKATQDVSHAMDYIRNNGLEESYNTYINDRIRLAQTREKEKLLGLEKELQAAEKELHTGNLRETTIRNGFRVTHDSTFEKESMVALAKRRIEAQKTIMDQGVLRRQHLDGELDAFAIDFVNQLFEQGRKKLLSTTELTPEYKKILGGIKSSEKSDIKGTVTEDLLGVQIKNNADTISSLFDTLDIMGVFTKNAQTGKIEIDTKRIAENPSEAMFEIRDKLMKVRERTREEINIWNDIISDDKEFLALVESGEIENNSHFDKLRDIMSYNLSQLDYATENAKEIEEARKKLEEYNKRAKNPKAKQLTKEEQDDIKKQQDIVLKAISPDIKSSVSATEHNISQTEYSIEELVEYANESIKRANSQITNLQNNAHQAESDLISGTSFTYHGYKIKGDILLRNDYNEAKELRKQAEYRRKIAGYERKMIPLENGGGFNTNSLGKTERTDYFEKKRLLAESLLIQATQDAINGVQKNSPTINPGDYTYKKFGLNKEMSALLYSIPDITKSLPTMSSEELQELLPNLHNLLNALNAVSMSEMTSDELKTKAIEMVNKDIADLETSLATINEKLEKNDVNLKIAEEKRDKNSTPGNRKWVAKLKNERRGLRQDRNLTEGALVDLRDNNKKGTAIKVGTTKVGKDGQKYIDYKRKYVTIDSLREEMSQINEQENKINRQFYKLLGVDEDHLDDFQTLVNKYQVAKSQEQEALQDYIIASNDANSFHLRLTTDQKKFKELKKDRYKILINGPQDEYEQLYYDYEMSRANMGAKSKQYGLSKKTTQKAFIKLYEAFPNAIKKMESDFSFKPEYSLPEQIIEKYGLTDEQIEAVGKQYEKTMKVFSKWNKELEQAIFNYDWDLNVIPVDKFEDGIKHFDELSDKVWEAFENGQEGRKNASEQLTDFVKNVIRQSININPEDAISSLDQIFAISGETGLKTSLNGLSKKDLRLIAEKNGYKNEHGNLPSKLTVSNLADLIVSNYINSENTAKYTGISNDEIYDILSSLRIRRVPNDELGRLIEEAEVVRLNKEALKNLGFRANDKGLTSSGVFDARVEAYKQNITRTQRQANVAKSSVQRVLDIINDEQLIDVAKNREKEQARLAQEQKAIVEENQRKIQERYNEFNEIIKKDYGERESFFIDTWKSILAEQEERVNELFDRNSDINVEEGGLLKQHYAIREEARNKISSIENGEELKSLKDYEPTSFNSMLNEQFKQAKGKRRKAVYDQYVELGNKISENRKIKRIGKPQEEVDKLNAELNNLKEDYMDVRHKMVRDFIQSVSGDISRIEQRLIAFNSGEQVDNIYDIAEKFFKKTTDYDDFISRLFPEGAFDYRYDFAKIGSKSSQDYAIKLYNSQNKTTRIEAVIREQNKSLEEVEQGINRIKQERSQVKEEINSAIKLKESFHDFYGRYISSMQSGYTAHDAELMYKALERNDQYGIPQQKRDKMRTRADAISAFSATVPSGLSEAINQEIASIIGVTYENKNLAEMRRKITQEEEDIEKQVMEQRLAQIQKDKKQQEEQKKEAGNLQQQLVVARYKASISSDGKTKNGDLPESFAEEKKQKEEWLATHRKGQGSTFEQPHFVGPISASEEDYYESMAAAEQQMEEMAQTAQQSADALYSEEEAMRAAEEASRATAEQIIQDVQQVSESVEGVRTQQEQKAEQKPQLSSIQQTQQLLRQLKLGNYKDQMVKVLEGIRPQIEAGTLLPQDAYNQMNQSLKKFRKEALNEAIKINGKPRHIEEQYKNQFYSEYDKYLRNVMNGEIEASDAAAQLIQYLEQLAITTKNVIKGTENPSTNEKKVESAVEQQLEHTTQGATNALNELNDSMIVLETGATDGAQRIRETDQTQKKKATPEQQALSNQFKEAAKVSLQNGGIDPSKAPQLSQIYKKYLNEIFAEKGMPIDKAVKGFVNEVTDSINKEIQNIQTGFTARKGKSFTAEDFNASGHGIFMANTVKSKAESYIKRRSKSLTDEQRAYYEGNIASSNAYLASLSKNSVVARTVAQSTTLPPKTKQATDSASTSLDNVSTQGQAAANALGTIADTVGTKSPISSDGTISSQIESAKELANIIQSSGKSTKDFFGWLIDGSIQLDEKLVQVLSNLNLIKDGAIDTSKLISDGTQNLGGFVNDQIAFIHRDLNEDFSGGNLELAKTLEEAYQAGIPVARILDIMDGKEREIFEIQEAIHGSPLMSDGIINPKALELSNEQLTEFVNNLKKMADHGLLIDENFSNFIIGKNGINFIDNQLSSDFNPEDERVGYEFENYVSDWLYSFSAELYNKSVEEKQKAVSFVKNIEQALQTSGLWDLSKFEDPEDLYGIFDFKKFYKEMIPNETPVLNEEKEIHELAQKSKYKGAQVSDKAKPVISEAKESLTEIEQIGNEIAEGMDNAANSIENVNDKLQNEQPIINTANKIAEEITQIENTFSKLQNVKDASDNAINSEISKAEYLLNSHYQFSESFNSMLEKYLSELRSEKTERISKALMPEPMETPQMDWVRENIINKKKEITVTESLAESEMHEAEAAKEDASAKRELNNASVVVDSGEAEKHEENAKSMQDESREAEHLADVRKEITTVTEPVVVTRTQTTEDLEMPIFISGTSEEISNQEALEKQVEETTATIREQKEVLSESITTPIQELEMPDFLTNSVSEQIEQQKILESQVKQTTAAIQEEQATISGLTVTTDLEMPEFLTPNSVEVVGTDIGSESSVYQNLAGEAERVAEETRVASEQQSAFVEETNIATEVESKLADTAAVVAQATTSQNDSIGDSVQNIESLADKATSGFEKLKGAIDSATSSTKDLSGEMSHTSEQAQSVNDAIGNTKNNYALMIRDNTNGGTSGGSNPMFQRYSDLIAELSDMGNLYRYAQIDATRKTGFTPNTNDQAFFSDMNSKIAEVSDLRVALVAMGESVEQVNTLWRQFAESKIDTSKGVEAIEETMRRFYTTANDWSGKQFNDGINELYTGIAELNMQLISGAIPNLDEYNNALNRLFQTFARRPEVLSDISNLITETSIKMNSFINQGYNEKYSNQFDVLSRKYMEFSQQLRNGDITKEQYISGMKKAISDFKNLTEVIPDFDKLMKSMETKGLKDAFPTQFTNLKNSFEQLKEEIKSTDITAEQAQKKLAEYLGTFNTVAQSDRSIFRKNQKVTELAGSYGLSDNVAAKDYIQAYLKTNYSKILSPITSQTMMINGEEVAAYTAEVQNANGMVERVKFSWSEVQGAVRMATQEIRQNQTGLQGMIDAIVGKVKQLSTYWTAQLFNPYRLIGYARKFISVIKEYDTAMMEIKKVSNESAESYNNLMNNSFKLGDSIGANAKDVLSSVAAWRRLGKDFEESQEAAVASNWLLNVSEFTNIDDATTSLVSMTQAFKDLSYESAIDKLNGVGDAFSSSTDQIASGMQNVASVLQVAGNDIDQSIALLTAANDVTQDMSKASMGVRTVALRIAGTQDAKQQLEDLGEDTSDFIVQTTSKVDAKVRKYTSTKSNPKGISVLDDTGRLRDTYSILLDISKVWSEIVEKDNEFGTNTSNALLELLAGKTRSNVLASILQSPDILEQAYETSKNSQGIGQRELDIYLDSVQAKTIQIQNIIQEIANDTINSEGLKTFLDIINDILKGVASLTDAFGGLSVVVGSVIGLLAKTQGFNVLNLFGRDTFKNGFFKNLKPTLSKFGENIKRFFKSQVPLDVTDFQDFFAGKENMLLSQAMTEYARSGRTVPPVLRQITDGMDENAAKALTLGQAFDALKQKTFGIQGAFKTFKSLGMGLLGGVLNAMAGMIITFIASKAIQGLFGLVDKVVNAKKNIIEAGKEAQQAISNIQSSFADKKSQTKSLGDRYNELRSGVKMDGNDIINLSLTSEEFEEFLEVNQDIANLYPSLITGTKNYGSKLVDLSTNSAQAKDTLNDYLNTLRQIDAYDIQTKLPVIARQIRKENEETTREIQKLQDTQDLYEDRLYSLFNINDLEGGFINEGATRRFSISRDSIYAEQIESIFEQARNLEQFDNLRIKSAGSKDRISYTFEAQTDEELREFKEYLSARSDGVMNILNTEQEKISANQEKLRLNWVQNFVPHLIESLYGDHSYRQLNEEVRDAIGGALYDFNWDDIDWNEDEIYDNITNKVIAPIQGAIESGKVTKAQVSDLFTLDFDNLTNEEYKDYVSELLETLFPDEEIRQQIAVGLDIMYEDEFGDYHYTVTKRRNEVYEMLGGVVDYNPETKKFERSGLSDEWWENIQSLSQNQTQTLLDMRDAGEFKEGIPNTFDELIVAIDEFLEKKNELKSEGTISDILKSESFKEDVDKYKEGIEKITSAIKEYNENGKIDPDTKTDLEESIGGVAQYFDDDSELVDELISKRQEQVQKYIEFMKQAGVDADLSDVEQTGWDEYIRTVIDSLGDLTISAEQAGSVIYNAISTKDLDKFSSEQAAERYQQSIGLRSQEISDALKEQYGDNLNAEILFYLSLDPDAATWTADEWVEKYNDTEVTFKLKLEDQELDRLEADNSRIESMIELRKAKGGTTVYGTEDEYNTMLQNLGDIETIKEGRMNLAKARLDSTEVGSSAWEAAYANYAKAETEWNQARIDTLNMQKEKLDASVSMQDSLIEQYNTEIERINQQAEEYKRTGDLRYGETQLQLQNLYENEAAQYRNKAGFFEGIANDNSILGRLIPESIKQYAKQQANEANAKATESEQKSQQASYAVNQQQLENLSNEYAKLETSAKNVNDWISVKQAKGLKATKKDYKDLAKISKEQIKNLKAQNEQLKICRDTTDDVAEKMDFQSKIDANNSSIASLMTSIEEYDNTIKNLIVNNAKELSSSISSAMSEMTTETGLTQETIDSLTQGFSDLGVAADISSIFYATADGVKVDMLALQRLAEQQNALVNQHFADEMDAVSEAIKRAGDSGDMSGLKQAQNQLAELQRQQAQYLATYQEQMQNFTQLAAIARADQTQNEGADYETAMGYMKTGKEMFDKGLIGTDDFKTRAAYLDAYGRTDWKTFEQNYKKAERYFTEDGSGVTNFLNDLVSKGLATYDSLTGYSLDFADTAKAAMEMGMSPEFFMDVLGRINDYGNNIQFVTSMEEASVKMSDLRTQLVDAKIELADLIAAGADSTALQAQYDKITEIEGSIKLLDEATENYTEGSQKSFIERFQNLPDAIDSLKQAYSEAKRAGDLQGMERIMQQVQDYADEFGIKINLRDFEIDRESYDQAAENLGLNLGERFREHAQAKVNQMLESEASGSLQSTRQDQAQEYLDIVDMLVPELNKADSKVNSILDTIRNADAKTLQEIFFGDGELSTNEEAAALETSIDGLIADLGLTQEQGNLLFQVLQEIAGYDFEINTSSNIDQTIADIEHGKEIINNLIKSGDYQFSEVFGGDKTGMSSDRLTQYRHELVNAQGHATRGSDTAVALQGEIDAVDREIRIQAIVEGKDQAINDLEELKELSDADLAEEFEIDISTEQGRQQLAELKEEINGLEEAPIKVQIDETQLDGLANTIGDALTNPEITLTGNNQDVLDKADAAEQYAEGKKPVMKIMGNSRNAIALAQSAVTTIESMHPVVTIGANTTGITSALDHIMNQQYRISVAARVSGMPNQAGNATSGASGTFRAFSSGSAYNVLNYRPLNAHARGTNVALDKDEYALTNELGTESVVRDGHWFTLPGGPHVEHLKKNDVVFSAQQTEDLLKYGKTTGHGKLVGARALASGTVAQNGMSAYYRNSSSASGSGGAAGAEIHIGTQNNYYGNSNSNTGSSGSNNNNNSNAASTGLEAFNKWAEKFFDWIEVRLQRLQEHTDRLLAKAENVIGYIGKNKLIDQAMNIVRQQISANQQGAARYQQHANTVRQQAITNGLVNAQQADEIIQRIQNGTIDINEYEEGARQFINSYMEWYNRIVACQDAVSGLQSQLVELQQTKLDNIVNRFDALANRSSAIQASSQAMVRLYTAQGRAVNSREAKQQLNSQMVRQNEITRYYSEQVAAYEAEMENAAKIFGRDSQQYHEAGQKLAEMNTALTESKIAFIELQEQMKELEITRINQVIDRLSSLGNTLSSIFDYWTKRGTRYGETETDTRNNRRHALQNQINVNNQQIIRNEELIQRKRDEIAEFGWEVGSEKYEEANQIIMQCEQNIISLGNANMDLVSEIRNIRWEPFEKLQSDIKNATSDFQFLAGLIDDAEVFDTDDQTVITDAGYAKLALYGEQIQQNNQYIANEREAMSKLEQEYKNGIISKEEYDELSRQHIENIQQTVSSNEQLKKSIIEVYKAQVTNENKALQELISLRKQALQSKKAYYDYNKTLKNKNKEIQQLRAEAAALEGVILFAHIYLTAGKPLESFRLQRKDEICLNVKC